MQKMKIEIWSDVMCPFCYMGKRRIEAAIGELGPEAETELEWKSYQLYPSMPLEPKMDSYDYLAEIKGRSRIWAIEVHRQLAEAASELGLDLRFDQARMTSSFDAHRMIQLAKKQGLADAMEERLFRAYFTEGELISDHETLVRLAAEAGLGRVEAMVALQTNRFAGEVHHDLEEARQLAIKAVPFFIFNRKYAVVGAQEAVVFRETLEKALEDFKTESY